MKTIKKLVSMLVCITIMFSCVISGVGSVIANAAKYTPSPESDFIVFDGVLEEYIGPGGDVVIPTSLGITEIANAAFINNKRIFSVVIPEGVHTIGRAFEDCTNLETVVLPYSLERLVGGNNFANCISLKSITIPGKLKVVPTWSFFGCTALEEIILSYGVEEIHSQAFGRVTCDVVFPETVKYIYGTAFNIQNSSAGATYTICNPNCMVGYFGGTVYDDENHIFFEDIHPPFQCWTDSATFRIIVPQGSEVEKFITENEDRMLNQGNEASNLDDYRIISMPTSYFQNLSKNQKDYGIVQTRTDITYSNPGNNSGSGATQPNNSPSNTPSNNNADSSNNQSSSNNSGSTSTTHTCTFGSWKVQVAATCTEMGRESRTCTGCNFAETRNISALGHKIENYTIILEPTCTSAGKLKGLCLNCGLESEQEMPKKEHTYKSETVNGVVVEKCSVCAAIKDNESQTTDKNGIKEILFAGNELTKGAINILYIILGIVGVIIVGVVVTVIIVSRKKKVTTVDLEDFTETPEEENLN